MDASSPHVSILGSGRSIVMSCGSGGERLFPSELHPIPWWRHVNSSFLNMRTRIPPLVSPNRWDHAEGPALRFTHTHTKARCKGETKCFNDQQILYRSHFDLAMISKVRPSQVTSSVALINSNFNNFTIAEQLWTFPHWQNSCYFITILVRKSELLLWNN